MERVAQQVIDIESPDDVALADRMKHGRDQIVSELHKLIIGQTDTVGAITVHADSTVDAKAKTFALAGGALGLSFNFALIDIETNIEASIQGGANIDASGTVTLEALSSHNAKGDVFALSIGLGAVGTSFVTVNVVPTTSDIYPTKSYDSDALVQPQSREAFRRLLAQGWTDALRTMHPDARIYTFWDYMRNRWPRDAGLRLDHLLLSPDLA